VADIEEVVPSVAFDFVHLPRDRRRVWNITLAYINFVDGEAALRAFFALSGRSWAFAPEARTCSVVPARLQGLKANLAHYMHRASRRRAVENPRSFSARGGGWS